MTNDDTTKVEGEQGAAAEEAAEELLSLESLDDIIAEEDPEFSEGLGEIGPDDPGMDIYDAGAELEYTLQEETRNWVNGSITRQKLVKFFPFLPKWTYALYMKRVAFRLSIPRWKEQLIVGAKNAGPWLKTQMAKLAAVLNAGFSAFKAFSLKKKFAFVGLLLATGAGAFIVYRSLTHRLVPQPPELFIGSLQELAEKTVTYDPKAEVESFYDSPRVAQNIILLKKMVANLKRSSSSGSNPMGAFEFYVEGTVNEVLVEIKDREPEILDLFLSTIRDTTYDQAASADGKRQLCERLRRDVNTVLTTGKVRRIFLKTAIVKP